MDLLQSSCDGVCEVMTFVLLLHDGYNYQVGVLKNDSYIKTFIYIYFSILLLHEVVTDISEYIFLD